MPEGFTPGRPIEMLAVLTPIFAAYPWLRDRVATINRRRPRLNFQIEIAMRNGTLTNLIRQYLSSCASFHALNNGFGQRKCALYGTIIVG